jgi:hypothetical protein
MIKKFLIYTLFLLSLSTTLLSQTVTDLRSLFKNGQTFLTWNSLPNKKITYYIYHSLTPITKESDINKANFLAKVESNSTLNKRLSELLGKNIYFKIDDIGNPLNDTKELYVHTPTLDGPYYYAVTVLVNDKIIPTVILGENSLKNPVYEKIEPVSAVYQLSIDTMGFKQNIYTHWVNKFENIFYPAMTSTYCFAYNFSVIEKSKKANSPLIVALHERTGNLFTNSKGTSNPDEIILSPDDYLPNDILHSYWFGYHQNLNIFNPSETPKDGIIIDYTVRRVKWTIDWVVKYFSVDTNRIYLSGGSMGGSGAILMSFGFPEKIAATYTVVPKLDYSFIFDPNSNSIYNANKPRRKVISRLWGELETNLMTNDSMPVYNRLNAGLLATKIASNKSLPYLFLTAGKNDNIVGWAEKLNVIKKFNDSRLGFTFFWDSRNHSSNSTMEFQPEDDINKIFKYSLNKSYPAFSNCSANGNPGNGLPEDGDLYGTINGFLNWENIVDEPDYYEISLNSKTLNTTHGTIKNPDSIFTDITLRRLQKFKVSKHYSYYYQNISLNNKVLQDGYIDADKSNLITLKNILITSKGNKLIIIRFDKE